MLLGDDKIETRRVALQQAGGFRYPAHQTPWQEMQRGVVEQLETSAMLEPALNYQRIAQTKGIPRDNH